jgi:hypothetical protein
MVGSTGRTVKQALRPLARGRIQLDARAFEVLDREPLQRLADVGDNHGPWLRLEWTLAAWLLNPFDDVQQSLIWR